MSYPQESRINAALDSQSKRVLQKSIEHQKVLQENENLKDQAFKQRSHAIQMYNDMKHLVEAMRDDAVGKMVLKARLNNYAHAFNIEK